MFEFLLNNQMLVAGVATVITGSFLYLVKYIPNIVFLYTKRLFTIELTINSKTENYEEILRVLEKHKIKFFSRNYSFSKNGNFLIPGYGYSYSFLDGVFYTYKKYLLDNKMDIQERIDITIFSKNKNKILALQKKAEEIKKENHPDSIMIHVSSSDYWTGAILIKKRLLETVFMDDSIKNSILNRIDFFLKNEQYYNKRGIPYKLCILLHGEPGTGKTSLIKAISSHYNKTIKFIENLNHFDDLIVYCKNDIVVVEDIDKIIHIEKNNGEEKINPNVILHKMLNSLDGMKSVEGTIIILTANDISVLDKALIRKGRVDLIENITPLEFTSIKKMFEYFYEEELPINNLSPIKGSILQDIFINNNKENAIKELEKWKI